MFKNTLFSKFNYTTNFTDNSKKFKLGLSFLRLEGWYERTKTINDHLYNISNIRHLVSTVIINY